MKKRGNGVPVILLAALLVTLALDFLALTDIGHDYVSESRLAALGFSPGDSRIPEWIACTQEWSVLRVSYLLRLLVAIFAGAFLLSRKKDEL